MYAFFLRLNLRRIRRAFLLIAWLSVAPLAWADDASPAKQGGYIDAVKGWLIRSAASRAGGPAAAGTSASASEAAKPSAAEAAKRPTPEAGGRAAAETKLPAERSLRFQFRFAPWKEVLDWFAREGDLSLIMETPPQGTFNYTDARDYTPAEALDILNTVLMTKGYMLIRHGRMLMLVSLEDPIPANLVPTVTVESLDTRGEFELVNVLFNLEQLKPEEAKEEVSKLLGPGIGTVVPLGKSRQISVTDTVAHLRAVRSVIERIEGPAGSSLGSGAPQLVVYPTGRSDPQLVLTAVRLLIAGQTDVQVDLDTKTNSLVALARPAKQAMIRAAVAQLQHEGDRVEVIHLLRLDPQTALQSINKLFGAGDVTKGAPAGPQVDVDLGTRQLMIRGTESQISQIRGLLEKMGEIMPVEGELTQGGRVRVLPLSGPAGMSAIKRIQEIWPTLRANKLVVEGDSSPVLLEQPGTDKQRDAISKEQPNPSRPSKPTDERQEKIQAPGDKSSAPKPSPSGSSKALPDEHSTGLRGGARIIYVAEESVTKAPADPKPLAPSKPPVASEPPAPTKPLAAAKAPAPIIVTPGANGLIIASEDTEALDQFERLLSMLGSEATNSHAISVFYLKYAKAAAATEMLGQMLGGSTVTVGSTGGGLGGLGGALGGGLGGGMPFGGGGRGGAGGGGGGAGRFGALGALLAARGTGIGVNPLGATTTTADPGTSRGVMVTGPIKITADPRLNALLVQANPADVETIQQLLKIIDQKDSPEDVTVTPKPQLIPVLHTKAQEIADIVRQVYGDRMVQGNAQMGGLPPMLAMMAARGGMGQPGGQQRQRDDTPKMSVGVDARTNSLIVVAPESLFEEVHQLVEQLDTAAGNENQSVRVVSLHNTSSATVEQALAALAGDGVQVTRSGTPGGAGSQGFQGPGGQFQQYRGMRSGGPGQQPGTYQGGNFGRGGMGQGGQGFQGGGFQGGGRGGGGFQGGGRGGGGFQGGGRGGGGGQF